MPVAPLLSLVWTLPATGLSIVATGGAVSLSAGGAALATFTETALDALILPALSNAVAISVFIPLGTPAEFPLVNQWRWLALQRHAANRGDFADHGVRLF
jgi:hypothetical protein